MMGSFAFSLFMFMRLLFSFTTCFDHLPLTVAADHSSSNFKQQPLLTQCHDDERSALLQFNQSFLIDEQASDDPSAYPKTASWKLNECCSWDGVECDGNTGHVIGLDLSSSFLYGTLNSTSSLFSLLHLQKLNLAYNNFNYSQIPPTIGSLSRLTNLNLSYSVFSGQIPSKILELSKLASLDLSGNVDPSSGENLLKLGKPNLSSLLQNLTDLKVIHLSDVNIFSAVPHILANFSSLTSLQLEDCGLHGEFPTSIFQLPNLQTLAVGLNPDLTGHLQPEFNKSSPLKMLSIEDTSFSGELPYSIGNLKSLNSLYLIGCNFSGTVPSSLANLTQLTVLGLSGNNFSGGTLAWLGKQTKLIFLGVADINLFGDIPSSLGNLAQLDTLELTSNQLTGQIPSLQNLTQLVNLYLPFNQLTGQIPSWLGNLTQLAQLDFCSNQLTGQIPSLGNLTQLAILDFSSNQLTGQIPSWLGNLTQLTLIDLHTNKLQGPIPQSFHRLVNLETLSLMSNNLSGTVELDMFINLKNLSFLSLSDNNLSLVTNTNLNATLPKFKGLQLGECNLSEFPDFLRHQNELEILILQNNKIQGQIPKWIWNVGKETLLLLELDGNFLTGFEQPLTVLPWTRLQVLELSSNMLQGSLPIPPLSTMSYSISDNLLTGEISPLICNLTSLLSLDLSNNNFSGNLPQCLGNFGNSLIVLNLRNNSFHGTISQICTNRSKLSMIDLGQNQLYGQVPRSLADCKMLEILDLGNNQINDTFPFWLGGLPKLRVLIMRSNKFHGVMRSIEAKFEFPKLKIIDLSCNSFTGTLPFEYFKNWNAMKSVHMEHLSYMQANTSFQKGTFRWYANYNFSITITYKGIEIVYAHIPEIFTAIDLSSNKFEGYVPESIGSLEGIQLLNLSNNILTGPLPSWLGNLTALESLDLSQNKLSGEIPQQLTGLTFLAFLNVSHNCLIGPIPQGKQFNTFEYSSFEGNSGLCGKPLSNECGHSRAVSPLPPSISEQGKDSKFPSGYDWIFIVAGYGSGLVVGLVIGHTFTTRKHKWFVETFGRRPQKKQREKKRGNGNRS